MPTLTLDLDVEQSGKAYRDQKGWAVFTGKLAGIVSGDQPADAERPIDAGVVVYLTHAEWVERERPTSLEVSL